MSESIRSKLLKLRFNFFPAYRRCGARITYISADLQHVMIKLPLKCSNMSHQGGIWGGSLYGALDPVYTIMLSMVLGKQYVVLDKSANINFLKQGKSTLYGHFLLKDDEIQRIRDKCAADGKVELTYHVSLCDDDNVTYVSAEKVIHVRLRQHA